MRCVTATTDPPVVAARSSALAPLGLVAAAFAGQLYTSTNSGLAWTAQETNRNWASVASSADGTNLVAAVSGGQLYTSTDAGITWTARDSARAWVSVASSADGTDLVASVSMNDRLIGLSLALACARCPLS